MLKTQLSSEQDAVTKLVPGACGTKGSRNNPSAAVRRKSYLSSSVGLTDMSADVSNCGFYSMPGAKFQPRDP